MSKGAGSAPPSAVVEAQDGEPVEQGAPLARASGGEGVLGNARTRDERLERGVSVEERLVAFGSLLDVGLNEHLAARREHARELVEQRRGENEALVVALLPPRIGKVDEHRGHGRGREARERLARVLGEHSSAPAVTERPQLLVDDGRPLALDLEPDDTNVRVERHTLEHEAASARTDLELDGSRSTDQEPRIDHRVIGQAGRVGVRSRGDVHGASPERWNRLERGSERSDEPRSSIQGRVLRAFGVTGGFRDLFGRAVRRHGLRAALTLTLAVLAIRGVLRTTGGEPAVPLDDAFIHFQYARSLWEGRGFAYSPGAEPAAGATSLLWPLLLAVPYGLGLRAENVIWAAWLFGWVSLGMLGYETRRASERLLSPDGALGAEMMVLTFGGYTWFASSGMEVVPLAWLLMRTARRTAEWAESSPRRARPTELLVLALLGPLLRPEGLLATGMVVATLLVRSEGRRRLDALLALSFAFVPGALNRLFTGSATTTTAVVKWLPMSPYLDGAELWDAVANNLDVLFGTLLDGQVWSAVFLPEGSRFALWPALPALVVAGLVRRARVRAALLLTVALGMLLPTTYDSFLWNRLRYLWPFMAAWFVGVAALADGVGALAARLEPALVRVRLLATGAVVGGLVSHLGWTLDDLATSADAIRKQQAALGRWAERALPEGATIGVNDTGAIAYFSGRRTFDVVGLTTAGEARYWAAGAGSRFEHYERLERSRLPTHFLVYPGWFALPSLLGAFATERTVPGATILGGETMVAHRANYDPLGSATRPIDPAFAGCTIVDELDVADLESEAAHAYELGDATSAGNVALVEGSFVDGARRARTRELFRLKVAPSGRLLVRVESEHQTGVEVRTAGVSRGRVEVAPHAWRELSIDLGAGTATGVVPVSIEARPEAVSTLHYWSLARCP